MDDRLLGFFSGFPSLHFPRDVAERLREELTQRESMVFVSANPAWHDDTDDCAEIMRGCFEEIGLPFAQYHVIDDRTEPSRAAGLIQEASCVHLMGGHPGKQIQFMRAAGLDIAICDSPAALLGVSAGAINMAKRSLDTKESPVPYEGLGLADITVKPHFEPKNRRVLKTLLRISQELPICAMEDDSAIFVAGGRISSMGKIHWIHRGEIRPLREGVLQG
ncbi:MAG: Type 1 glutamine amidotransferase-like domain-containing protein [Oscillospiraceae bacterium]|jgi:peptidase E|nr:Type 1 glutamine amidotransferase-like domain-containing protein [Oscillospiraceae bacterium]